jgi:hypothetical protein
VSVTCHYSASVTVSACALLDARILTFTGISSALAAHSTLSGSATGASSREILLHAPPGPLTGPAVGAPAVYSKATVAHSAPDWCTPPVHPSAGILGSVEWLFLQSDYDPNTLG